MSQINQECNRCLHCKNPQCVVGCPVGYDIPTFLAQTSNGDFAAATATVGHLFGEICGYVCPYDVRCKGHCILNKKNAPVNVGAVEKYAFERHFPTLRRESSLLSHLKVAVVGGGVSGITFAAECYRLGAKITIYERAELLFTLKSLPYFRLPPESVNKVVNAVLQSEISVKKQNVFADDLQQFLKDFDIVYLATGASVPHKMNIPNEEYAALADDFLRGNQFDDAIIVGGGNTAMDAARLNAKHGFHTVVAYRRTRADMPAFDKEIASAMAENVQFVFNVAPVCIKKQNGLSVTFAKTISEGRGKLVLTDNLVTLNCQKLVSALGSGYDSSVFAAERFLKVDSCNNVCQNLFAGGDATGKSLVAEAVADGLRAASAVAKKYGASA